MYTYIYIHMYTCIHAYIYVHIHMYTYIHMYIHLFTYIYVYIQIHIYSYIYSTSATATATHFLLEIRREDDTVYRAMFKGVGLSCQVRASRPFLQGSCHIYRSLLRSGAKMTQYTAPCLRALACHVRYAQVGLFYRVFVIYTGLF